MSGIEAATLFAPAERAPHEVLQRQTEYFAEDLITRHLLDAIPTILAVLNSHRQIVYANQSLLEFVGEEEAALIQGRLPGETLQCVHVEDNLSGCGTGETCRNCGAVLAIMAGLAGRQEVRECRITRQRVGGRRESLDLMVWATPLEHGGERFTVFAVKDISDQKRRLALERTFFHDVLNVVGSIKGFAEIYQESESRETGEVFQMIHSAADRVIDEIQSQRTLAAAEAKDLQVSPGPVSSRTFVEKLVGLYRHHEAAKDRHLETDEGSADLVLVTDATLLGRVLGNMIKNALEATSPGATATVGCRPAEDGVEFWVRNPGMIPRHVQLQVFQRSFSTKGAGRGLGTYAMQLLSEYLGGRVSFVSTEEEGTIFRAVYPAEI